MNPNDILQKIFQRMSTTYNFFGRQGHDAQERFSATAAGLLSDDADDPDVRYQTAREHFRTDMTHLLTTLPPASITRESAEHYLLLLDNNDTIWFTI